MSRYRFGITTIGFWLILAITIVLMEGINFLLPIKQAPLSISDLTIVSLTIAFSALVYYIIEKRANKAKIAFGVLPIILILLFSGLFGIWYSPSEYTIGDVSFTYNVELITKVTWTLQLVIGLFVMYLAFGIFSKRILKVKSLRIIFWGIIVFALFTIIYSLANEFSSYQAIILGEKENIKSIKSIFINENVYGQMLLIGIMAFIAIDAIKSKWWHFIFFVILFAAMIFSTSFTSLLCAGLMFNLYIIYLFFKTIRKHPYRNTILISLYATFLVILVCCYCFLDVSNAEIIKNFSDFIENYILNKDYHTFTGRTYVWEFALSTLQTPLDYIFGKGYGNFNELVNAYRNAFNGGSMRAVDSTYVQILGSFGVLGLFVYVTAIFALIGIGIYCLAKKRVRIVLPSLILLITMLIYGAFETYILFLPNAAGMMSFVLIALPILIEFNRCRSKPYFEKSLMSLDNQLNVMPFSNKMIVQFTSLILGTLLLIVSINFVYVQDLLIINALLFGVVLLLFIFYPYMLAMWHQSSSHRLVVFRCVVLTLILLLGPLAIAIPITTNNFSEELFMAGYLIAFAIILSIELCITMIASSSPKQMIRLIFNYTIKPNIVFLVIFILLFVPPLYLLNAYFEFSKLFIIFSWLFIGICYPLSLYFIPNLGSSKSYYQIVINQLNNRYILKQKMLFVLNKI